jgi:ankyrin repeat protein
VTKGVTEKAPKIKSFIINRLEMPVMKHLLLTTIAAVLLMGCGPSVDIHQAAKAGNIKAVKQHLDAGADVELKCVNCGSTVLGHAAEEGHKEIAELLIAEGADVNAKDDNGTPLHNAASWGHKEVVELFIAAGADVNAKGFGETPLDLAVITKNTEVADLLRKHGGKTGEELKAEGK